MIKSSFCLACACFLYVFSANANYTTPGTGIKYSLTNLVALSGGNVTYTDAYFVNDTITISLNDTLSITTDAILKFAVGSFFEISGTIIVNPPTGVLFTAQNTATGYLGMRLNTSVASTFKKLTFEYAVSFRLSDCSPTIDSCTFQYNNNNASTTFGNGAIALFRSNPVITNSKFLNNQRAAIQGGANIANAPKIINCLFMDNNTTNQNVPQINLGASGVDTVKIINNQILRASNRSGGIGFLPIGDVRAVIWGNVIKNNRYGITFNGGSNINSAVSYNVIDSNNTEGNPITGGSGISFSGGSSTSHQNSIVTGNYIRGNLWGITISPGGTGGAKPNLGNLLNSDTTDDGKNRIYGNTNATTPFIDFYNNNVDEIMAQGNYWGADDEPTIEARIFHRPDNAALGLVNFSNYILPIELHSFSASLSNGVVTLQWRTSSENNSDHFQIEKSEDGRGFYLIGKLAAAGQSSLPKEYWFVDRNLLSVKQYYRLKFIDKDGSFKYSSIVSITPGGMKGSGIKIYPTNFTGSQMLVAEIVIAQTQTISLQFFSVDGKLLHQFSKLAAAGTNTFRIESSLLFPNGVIQVRCIGEDIKQTITLIKY
jgi:hypothetical protein